MVAYFLGDGMNIGRRIGNVEAVVSGVLFRLKFSLERECFLNVWSFQKLLVRNLGTCSIFG